MNTRENLQYTKVRDELNEKQRRIKNLRQREVGQQNEKMFAKLMAILNRENSLKRKHQPGSLNLQLRRHSVNTINKENHKLMVHLQNTKCQVPSFEDIQRRIYEKSKLMSNVSTRQPDGKRKLDPLVSKRAQFVRATSQMNSVRNQSSGMDRDNTSGEKKFIFGTIQMPPSQQLAPTAEAFTATPSNQSHVIVASPTENDSQSAMIVGSMTRRRASSGLPFDVQNI